MSVAVEGNMLTLFLSMLTYFLELKKSLLNLLREIRTFLHALMLKCLDSMYIYSRINLISNKELGRSSRSSSFSQELEM